MKEGAIESLRVPTNPLDVLAQQIVATTALDGWDADELFELVRRSASFATLPRSAYDATLDLLAGRAHDLEPYQVGLDAALNRLSAGSWKAKLAFDRFPRLTFAVARLPLVWPFFEEFVRGEVKSPADARGLVRAPLRLVEALGRA
jgi:hypothetical protein